MIARLLTLVSALGLAVVSICSARGDGLTRISSISLRLHPDSFYLFNWEHYRHGPLFDMAVAPDGDFLALVGMQDSHWQLIRVKEWWSPNPVVDRVTVPGYGRADEPNRFGLTPQVLVSPDSKFAVAIASASWPDPVQRRAGTPPQQPDALLTLVNLQTFTAVKTLRASELGLETSEWRFDSASSLRADGLSPAGSGEAVGSERWVAFLSMPELRVIQRCDYSVPTNSGALKFVLHEPASPPCQKTVGELQKASDDYYLHRISQHAELKERLNASCGIEGISPDEKYAFGSCRDGHDTLWGYSWGPESTTIYSIHEPTVEVLNHKPHHLTDVRLATVAGNDYVLALEDAERLTVYRLEKGAR
jgi:hypothetical protein